MAEQKKEVSISLQAYDAAYCPAAVGIQNIGNTCFFNAIVQAIISLTSIFKTAHQKCDSDSVVNNPVLQSFLRMVNDSAHIDEHARLLYREMIGKSLNRMDRTRMHIATQEDSYEMFLFILEEMCKCPDIDLLFNHRTTTIRKCLKKECGYTSITRDINQMFIVDADMKVDNLSAASKEATASQDLNDFIKKYVSCVPDFKCVSCDDKSTKLTFTKVTMIPEIICVVFKKYLEKPLTSFPMKLKFSDVHGKKNFVYELVAQVEQSGNQNGGHYNAICKRSDGWKLLDDSYVSNAEPGPTRNTYIIFYHYVGDEPLAE